MFWRNEENTAATAIQSVTRMEREERRSMAKRSCRRTQDEDKIHEKAVKIRKMTDAQLVHYIEDRVEKARSEGRNEGRHGGNLKVFLESLASPGVIPGVGLVTVDKIRRYAEEGGFFG